MAKPALYVAPKEPPVDFIPPPVKRRWRAPGWVWTVISYGVMAGLGYLAGLVAGGWTLWGGR